MAINSCFNETLVDWKHAKNDGIDGPYSNVTLNKPLAIFEDKSIEYERFNKDIKSDKLCNVVRAMNNRHIVDANVLCPWSCSTSCREAGRLPLDILIQRMLPKIIVSLYSDSSKYRRVQSSWNQYMRSNVDTYLTILLDKEWRIKPTVLIDEEGIRALTCQYHDGGEDK